MRPAMIQIKTIAAKLQGDRNIWLVIALLSFFSVLAVYSSTGTLAFKYKGGNTEFYLLKHVGILLASIGVMFFCHRVSHDRYRQLAPFLMIACLPLLLYTLVFGQELNDAARWITIPVINLSFQTSDMAKLALIIYVARVISVRQDRIKDFKAAFLPVIVPILATCGLIAPADLSSALMLFSTCLIIMFVGRVDLKYIGLLILIGIVCLSLLIIIGQFAPDVVRIETWTSRVTDFVTNSEGPYQIQQAKIAVAEGGWLGLGPGNSMQRNFIPHPYSDFIFAVILEEYGLIGGAFILCLYVVLFLRCVRLVTQSPKAFGAILAFGLCLSIVLQALTNMAVTVHLLPVTGLPLPLLSMGGTSLIFTSVALGIILSVSRSIESNNLQTVAHESHH